MSDGSGRWRGDFDADRLARLEWLMWKAYYRRQRGRLLGLLVLSLREQAGVGWGTAVRAAVHLTRAAVGFANARNDYDRFVPAIAAAYRALGVPAGTDPDEVAARELRWWVVRREAGMRAGDQAGQAIARLYAALYDVPEDRVMEAGRLRGLAAEVRDRGAADDPDGPSGEGAAYWPAVGRLLRASYRSLARAVALSR